MPSPPEGGGAKEARKGGAREASGAGSPKRRRPATIARHWRWRQAAPAILPTLAAFMRARRSGRTPNQRPRRQGSAGQDGDGGRQGRRDRPKDPKPSGRRPNQAARAGSTRNKKRHCWPPAQGDEGALSAGRRSGVQKWPDDAACSQPQGGQYHKQARRPSPGPLPLQEAARMGWARQATEQRWGARSAGLFSLNAALAA